MTTPQDLALNYLLIQNNSEQQVLVKLHRKIVKVVAAKPEPLITSKPSKGIKAKPVRESTPNNSTPSLGLVLPAKGTYDARSFIIAMRKASDRNEQIKLLAGYVGYDVSQSFGQQESAARSKALRDLNCNKIAKGSRAEEQCKARSLSGSVAGLPNDTERRMANLEGQERSIVEAMISHERDALDESRPLADRLLSRGLVEVETARLADVRTVIATMLGN